MIKKSAQALAIIFALLASALPCLAQFDGAQTYIATSGGSGTAYTVALGNVGQLADLVGVPLRIKMSANSGASPTLQVNSLTATAIKKMGPGGLVNVAALDIIAAQISQFVYDGTVFELLNPATNASLNIQDQTLSGGANVTSNNLGTITTGTVTVDCGKGPLQYLTNGGTFTIAAPANDGACVIQITNNASANFVGFSGFTVNANYTGASLNTVNGSKFMMSVTRVNGSSIYVILPQQ